VVKILARHGERLQAEVIGWRRDGLEETLFAQVGKRMPLATLNAAATPVETLEETEDPDTGMIWRKVKLAAWTAATGSYAADAGALWRYAAQMYDDACTLCHAAYPPDRYAANDWVGHMNAMRRLTKLTEEEGRLLLAYLQNAARDVKGVNL
ncbi:MAG TPA: cytochrome C, partial [Azospirillaceae bacterium]|nr:cytochrome C [Azospirillaceae bacterium]